MHLPWPPALPLAAHRRRALSDVELRLVAMKMLEPERFHALLRRYFALLGDAVVDAADAIDRAERGQRPHDYALSESAFKEAYSAALHEIRALRRSRDMQRCRYNRMAAALLAESRLRNGEGAA